MIQLFFEVMESREKVNLIDADPRCFRMMDMEAISQRSLPTCSLGLFILQFFSKMRS